MLAFNHILVVTYRKFSIFMNVELKSVDMGLIDNFRIFSGSDVKAHLEHISSSLATYLYSSSLQGMFV